MSPDRRPPAQRPRVLVVDDERPQLDMLDRWLTFSGYEVVAAASGEEAMAWARAGVFDVIVTDLRMPGFDGVRLLDVLTAVQPGVPAIVLSGQGTVREVLTQIRAGDVFEFLQKPLRDLGQLTRTIESARATRGPQAPGPRSTGPGADMLTAEDRELLDLLEAGRPNLAVAQALGLELEQVRERLRRIGEQLGTASTFRTLEAYRRWRTGPEGSGGPPADG